MLRTRNLVHCLCCGVSILLAGACASEPDVAETEEPAAAVSPTTPVWEATGGMDTPESAYMDAGSGYIFVSQIAGTPDGRDGNGRIVQLSGDGDLVSDSWVTGLNAPKGLRSHDGILWTADIDEVIGVEIATGEIVSRVAVEGAQFLNDVAVGGDGTVYVSDMAASRIYAVRDGAVEVFAEGEELEYPNGLLVDGDRLIVGAWGRPEADFSTPVPGRLFALDLETKEKTLITPDPFGNIDGVESDGRGGFIVTDFNAGKVMRVAADGTVVDLAQFGTGTADLAFLAGENLAIVPHMMENRVAAYDLSGVLP